MLPVVVMAQANMAAPRDMARTLRNFCTALSARPAAERFADKVAEREQRLAAKRSEIDKRMGERRGERDLRLEKLRVAQDAKRGEAVARLQAKFTSEEQKTAILAFQSAVQAAAEVRRAAVDAANKTFRKGVDEAKVARKAAVDSAVDKFQGDMKAAEDAAKASCGSAEADQTAVRETLRAAVEEARSDMRTAVQAAAKVGPDAAKLNETRRAAVEKAVADWKAAVEQARVDLKAALGTTPK
jgi:hypothetical protein